MKENGPWDETLLSRRRFGALCAGAGALALLPGSTPLAHRAERMATRPIPSSGEALPVVGVGTWQTFDVGSGAAERAPLAKLLDEMFKAGGTVIDSSPMYGRSEGVVGELLAEAGSREAAFLATKVWIQGRGRGIAQMRQSLARFRTEKIDLMQVHNLVDWETQLDTLRQWKADGVIRYIGLTHYTESAFPELGRIMDRETVDFVQIPYSIGVRGAEDRLLPLAAERGIAVLVNRPYETGTLFRAVRGRTLPGWAAEFHAASWGQFFLKYLLSHPAVTCVIPGTSKVKHMVDNAAAGHGKLPDEAQRRRMVAFMKEL